MFEESFGNSETRGIDGAGGGIPPTRICAFDSSSSTSPLHENSVSSVPLQPEMKCWLLDGAAEVFACIILEKNGMLDGWATGVRS